MEHEVDCQTEGTDPSNEIKISERINDILVGYAKSMILHNPVRECSGDNVNEIKKILYKWSKEYFKKLCDGYEENNSSMGRNDAKVNSNDASTEICPIKDKVKKEMERVNFTIHD
ncbi:conserved Plasmodium protein, unknown function [Plasmodium ovale]|uniref:Uncharacterized protein n=2 Tax=Plasmodium ovale TaxID=36330 RepID=A0A1A8WMJ3_PLAOA|nr:hypothetical protein, conserved [Plasmodium ovale curtisi]SBS94108.1 hypothetical protein, conserved [Plasmodium ovale curtisi]SCP05001.1 conserved Plasmodium protein, unknown function [Plasmodium ovale]